MNNIWYIADTHFGHSNILKYCGRPFETKDEHDEAIIANWNALVHPKDHVYHLGDVGFGSPDFIRKTLARLHGKIHLIKGNHDGPATNIDCAKRFIFIKDVHFSKHRINGDKVEIFLSHYPHRSWPKSYHGSYHLFGHVHGNLPPFGNSFDVGVDVTNFRPISLEDVHKKMIEMKNSSNL